uniref:HlyD family efflux transporter periplasmic adaptor subunit n=1 Tax=Roseihalotalea indica TaxID=2867963 RepID=A0AA49GN95_9BACT|nr:HlyD family efflux transporter periplasmic adaptor subunit [Tunicatimonas sp. TK19036]
MKRPSILAIAAISLISTITLSRCGDSVETTQPQTKRLTAAVYASGTLLPEQEYQVFSTVDGYLQEAYVKEGDTVRQGQPLFYVSNQVREVQEQGANAVVERTLPTVAENAPIYQELEGRIEVARIKMEQDKLQHERYQRLLAEKAISQSTYEKYYLQYQSSLKDYQNLQRQYEQQQLSGQLQLQQARNQLLVNQAQQSVGRLKSFVDGIVYDIYRKPGGLITPTQPVALIGTGDLIAKLSVDEDDLDKVYEGQKVLITFDAYGDQVFPARITKIYPLLNQVEQSFRVDAEFEDKLPVGIYGLNLEANIVVTEDKEVMVLPRTALLKGDSVWVMREDEEVKVPVQTGIADDQWIEITKGLDANTTVILK